MYIVPIQEIFNRFRVATKTVDEHWQCAIRFIPRRYLRLGINRKAERRDVTRPVSFPGVNFHDRTDRYLTHRGHLRPLPRRNIRFEL